MSGRQSLALAPDLPVGDLVRLSRVAAGLSRDDLGDLVGLSAMTITRIERGERELRRGEAIAIAQVTGQDASLFDSSLAAGEGGVLPSPLPPVNEEDGS